MFKFVAFVITEVVIIENKMRMNQQMEFVYFETFYKTYRETFKKPADSLILFIHWFMLQNRYQSIFNNTVSSESHFLNSKLTFKSL